MNTLIRILLFILFLISNNIISNAQPSITWQRLYNGPSNTHDNGRGICETANGNIYLTGFIPSPKAVVLKLKPNGDTIWTKYFDNIRGDFILPTSDGGCILTGQSSLVYTLKLDSNGNSQWLKFYNGSDNIITTDFIKTNDKGYAICGNQTAVSPSPSYVIKLDSNGNVIWQKYFNSGYIKVFNSIYQKADSNFIITGYKYECELCNGYPILLELKSSGDSLWEKKYNYFAEFKKVFVFNDNYLISGTILDSPFVNSNSFILRTNLNGDVYFKKNIYYYNREDLKDMEIISNNKYVITCDTDTLDRRSAGVYILDSLGNKLHRNIFYVSDYSLFFSISLLSNKDLVFSGTVETYFPQYRNIYVVRSDSTLFAKPLKINENNFNIVNNYNLFQNYPNPFNPSTIIKYNINDKLNQNYKIKIFDILGKEMFSYALAKPFSGEIIFDGKNLSSGIYFYCLLKEDIIVQTNKMMKIQ